MCHRTRYDNRISSLLLKRWHLRSGILSEDRNELLDENKADPCSCFKHMMNNWSYDRYVDERVECIKSLLKAYTYISCWIFFFFVVLKKKNCILFESSFYAFVFVCLFVFDCFFTFFIYLLAFFSVSCFFLLFCFSWEKRGEKRGMGGITERAKYLSA